MSEDGDFARFTQSSASLLADLSSFESELDQPALVEAFGIVAELVKIAKMSRDDGIWAIEDEDYQVTDEVCERRNGLEGALDQLISDAGQRISRKWRPFR